MRKAVGLVFAVVGVGVGGYAWQNADSDRHATEQLAAMVRIASEGSRPASVGVKIPAADLATPMAQVASPVRITETSPRADRSPSMTDARPASGGFVAQTGDSGSERTRIAERPPGSDDAPARPLKTSKTSDDGSRRELAKSIQAELKRVGCFEGEIDGSWSPASKQAMKRFTERVNATLPIEQPDYILLTLLQGHADRACGISCPSGQVAAADGRCLPHAIVAQEERKFAPKVSSPKAAIAVETERREATAARRTETTDAQIVRDRAIEAARVKEQKALDERQARIAAERVAQERAAEEQRAKAEAASAEARRARELAIEQRKAQELARLEADRQAKARAADEQRAKAELAVEEARRTQQVAVEQRQLAERKKAEDQARAADEQRVKVELAAVEARRKQQIAREQKELAERAKAEELQRIEAERLAAVAASKEKQRLASIAEVEKARRLETASTIPATTPLNAAEPPAKMSSSVDVASQSGAGSSIPGMLPPIAVAPTAALQVVAPSGGSGESSKVQVAPSADLPKVKRAAAAKASREQTARRNEVPPEIVRREPRFVQRFIPPPYYVGRVIRAPQPVFRPAPVYNQRSPGPSLGNRLYHNLSRNSP